MRSRQIIARGLAAALLFLLGGCVYVPPFWDLGDAIRSVDEIQEGKTTRSEVREILGEPQAQDGERMLYRGSHSDGIGCIVNPLAVLARSGPYQNPYRPARKGDGACATIYGSRWEIEVFFDEADVVSQVVVVDGSEPVKSERLAGKSYPSLQAVCLGAHANEFQAQSKLGDLYRDGSLTDLGEPDLERAYLWYALSQQNGSAYGEIRLRGLFETMTPGQLTRARKSLGAWVPDPASCGFPSTPEDGAEPS